jgi:hypothetical protein
MLCVIYLKGVRFLVDVRTSDRSANLGAVAAGGLVSDQSTIVFPNSLARTRSQRRLGDSDALGAEAAGGLSRGNSRATSAALD